MKRNAGLYFSYMSGTGRLEDKKNIFFFIPRLIQDSVELDGSRGAEHPSQQERLGSVDGNHRNSRAGALARRRGFNRSKVP
jgi:uncharacterized protein YggL (DUF469 family)